MATRPDDVPASDAAAAAGLSGPPYPQQPVDGERPVPLRGRPERTQDPREWDSDSLEPVTGREPDASAEEFARRTKDERASHADGRAGERAPHIDEESSYATEQEQGAAQPGPPDDH